MSNHADGRIVIPASMPQRLRFALRIDPCEVVWDEANMRLAPFGSVLGISWVCPRHDPARYAAAGLTEYWDSADEPPGLKKVYPPSE